MTSIKFRALTDNEYKLFFEALGEYGKDFQQIQQYMAQRRAKTASKTNDQNKTTDFQEKRDQDKKEDDKKREQIRNFYNKLYGRLSQWFTNLDDRIEKVNQELYLLINYGEIWKRHEFKFTFNNKTRKLLEELVYQGNTSLRFKNRQVRIRIPACKALKKINGIGIDEKDKVVTARELPKDVVVEFHPATNRDWLKVQSMSQNPRVRAKLSIQKRMSSILEFLEYKWNLSQDKTNRTVDAWLKVPNNSHAIEDIQQQAPGQQSNGSSLIQGDTNNLMTNGMNQEPVIPNNLTSASSAPTVSNDQHIRIRLKPSSQHELNEVNITRVIPENHLDLSLNAYIRRLNEIMPRNPDQTNKNSKESSLVPNLPTNEALVSENHLELSQDANCSSRLSVSLTTPDSSIFFERSMTSDQPSIARTRKHLNILQTIAGSFEGCENSRTACEDTQDRSLPAPPHFGTEQGVSFGQKTIASQEENYNKTPEVTVMINNCIPALFDEDAAIDSNLLVHDGNKQVVRQSTPTNNTQPSSDSQNSKSDDFNIPRNVSLGDYLKMCGHGGDEANDAFPTKDLVAKEEYNVKDSEVDEVPPETHCSEANIEEGISDIRTNPLKPQNHMIEIKKLAEGWTKQEEPCMTIGELYLAFKCPDKIILEYEFEQFIYENQQLGQTKFGNLSLEERSSEGSTRVIPEPQSNSTLIFKLLTAASLSLAKIERQKQEQQHKLHDQPLAKLKRRKGTNNSNTIKFLRRDDSQLQASASGVNQEAGQFVHVNGAMINNHDTDNNNYLSVNNEKATSHPKIMTLHDIAVQNQLVGKTLKELQSRRWNTYRRAR